MAGNIKVLTSQKKSGAWIANIKIKKAKENG